MHSAAGTRRALHQGMHSDRILRRFSLFVWIVVCAGVLSRAAAEAPGDLDPSFGTNGKVTTPFFATDDFITSGYVQTDGRIVVGGQGGPTVAGSVARDFLLARHRVDGALDTTFGTGGKFVRDLGSDEEYLNAVAYVGGGLIAGGTARGPEGIGFILAKFLDNGAFFPSFGVNGIVRTSFGPGPDNDEGINAICPAQSFEFFAGGYARLGGSRDFALVRYLSNGQLDARFGVGGKVTTDFAGGDDEIHALLLQTDGKLVAIGQAAGSNGVDFAIARYNNDGSLDQSFGVGGKMTTDFQGDDDLAFAALLLPNGKIVVGGQARMGNSDDFALVRYHRNGSLDPSFGIHGRMTTDFFDATDGIRALAVQPGGKLAAAGSAQRGPSTATEWALARYSGDGIADPNFGSGGKVTASFANTPGPNNVRGLVTLSDGKMIGIGAGISAKNGDTDFALARFVGDANAAPQVQISYPPPGTILVAGRGMAVAAEASDSDGEVSKVEFLIDGGVGFSTIYADFHQPFQIGVDTPAPGNHVLTARAYDNLGRVSALSDPVPINVTPGPPAPTFPPKLTSPEQLDSFPSPAKILLRAGVSAGTSATGMQFYAGTTLIGTVTTPPYEMVWSTANAGWHSISAKMITSNGAESFGGRADILVAGAPAVVSAASRKLHAGVAFDLPLPVSGKAGIECRQGTGALADAHQLIVAFEHPVSIAQVEVGSTSGKAAVSAASVASNLVQIDLAGVGEAERIILNLGGVTDGGAVGDISIPLQVLVGDVDGNGAVNASDLGQTKIFTAQPISPLNFRADVNTSGAINASDVGLVKSKVGGAAP